MSSHRQITAAIIFAVILIGGVIVIKLTRTEPKDDKVTSVATTRPELEIDTDKDGLKDWEEELWQTNKENADTDGDGANDGTEVLNDRNPRVHGPNDLLYSEDEVEIDENLTPTDIFARNFFARYVEMKEQGGVLDEESQVSLINTTLSEAPTSIPYQTYTRANIRIASVDNADSMKIYGNMVGAAVLNSFTAGKLKNEIAIIQDSLQLENEKELEKMDPIIAEYKTYRAALLATPVPESIHLDHIRLINSISEFIAVLEGFKVAFTDPVTMLFAMRQYPFAAKNAFDATDIIIKRIQLAGVVFSESESGYALMTLTTPLQ